MAESVTFTLVLILQHVSGVTIHAIPVPYSEQGCIKAGELWSAKASKIATISDFARTTTATFVCLPR